MECRQRTTEKGLASPELSMLGAGGGVGQGVPGPPMEVPRLLGFCLEYPVWRNFAAISINPPSTRAGRPRLSLHLSYSPPRPPPLSEGAVVVTVPGLGAFTDNHRSRLLLDPSTARH